MTGSEGHNQDCMYLFPLHVTVPSYHYHALYVRFDKGDTCCNWMQNKVYNRKADKHHAVRKKKFLRAQTDDFPANELLLAVIMV